MLEALAKGGDPLAIKFGVPMKMRKVTVVCKKKKSHYHRTILGGDTLLSSPYTIAALLSFCLFPRLFSILHLFSIPHSLSSPSPLSLSLAHPRCKFLTCRTVTSRSPASKQLCGSPFRKLAATSPRLLPTAQLLPILLRPSRSACTLLLFLFIYQVICTLLSPPPLSFVLACISFAFYARPPA